MITINIRYDPELDQASVAKLTRLIELCFPDAWKHTYDRSRDREIRYKMTKDWSMVRHDRST